VRVKSDAPSPTRPLSRPFLLAVTGSVALGLALRLSLLNHGLPDLLEEAIPLRTALQMWRWRGPDDLNPHMFQYPSLTIYLHYLIQKLGHLTTWMTSRSTVPDYLLAFATDPTFHVRLSRALGIAADAASIVCVGILGHRIAPAVGVLAAAMTAVAPLLIVTSTCIFTDNVMAALGLIALVQMEGYLRHGKTQALILAAVFIGLASSSKYSAVSLLVPLIYVLLVRSTHHPMRRTAAVLATATATFLLTTPFALLDYTAFWHGASAVVARAATGHLGAMKSAGVWFYVRRTLDSVGYAGIVGTLISCYYVRRSRLVTCLWIACMAYAVPVLLAHAAFERYLVPIVPLLAMLGSTGVIWAVAKIPRAQRPISTAIACGILLVPPSISAMRAVAQARTSTQVLARQWMENHVAESNLLMQERYGAEVLTATERGEVVGSALFHDASGIAQKAFEARRWYHSVPLGLVVGGPLAGDEVGSRHTEGMSVVDLNGVYYHLGLLWGVDYVATSAAVRGRFEAERDRFRAQGRFYDFLDRNAELVASFASNQRVEGPEVRIYHLGPLAQARLGGLGLDRSWWRAGLAESRVGGGEAIATTADSVERRATEGAIYERWYAPFVRDLIANHRGLGHCERVRTLALSHLEVMPGDVPVFLAYLRCARLEGAWAEARDLSERVLRVVAKQEGWIPPEIALEYADVLAHTGEVERAKRWLQRVHATATKNIAEEARRRLSVIERTRS